MQIPKLNVLQKYADEVAKKLDIDCQPIIRWLQEDDECRELDSHCHTIDLNQKRGTICIPRSYMKKDHRGWQWIIAHEVCHLCEKSCDSPYFAKLMTQVGF
ncbi:MAG: hypothetical protein MUP81_06265 [Dehalococcoidia bacterium]|nr:hypothetical protein [Dehalococcoidia bacterium]